MLPPPKKAGDAPKAVFSLSNSLKISSKSKNPDMAAKFIAWLVSAKSTRDSGQVRNERDADLAAVKASDAPTATGREVLQAMKTHEQRGHPLPWLDPSPRMLLEIYGSGLQEVLGGKKSVADLRARRSSDEQRAQVEERVKKGYGLATRGSARLDRADVFHLVCA